MSFPSTLCQTVLDTVIGRLTVLFLTGAAGDLIAARRAASQMLAAYNIETDDELRLAAEIISFSFHALEALSQASAPGVSLNQTLRLRGSAVSLSRESHKCQRKLDALQRVRRAGIQPQPEPMSDRPRIDKAIALIEAGRQEKPRANPLDVKVPWPQTGQKRQMAERMTENLRRQAQATQQAAQA